VPDAHQLLLFVAGGLLLNLTPGPDVLFIVSNALRRGARDGAVAALGITAGCFVHVLAAALGLGALLSASATAFTVVKWAGAAYLLWVGTQLLFAKRGPQASAPAEAAGSPFVGAFWTNVLNPKVAVFFLAFVPQFIAPGAEHKALAFLMLGVLFNLTSLPVNVGWALAAAWMARRDAIQRGMHLLDRAAGAMFIAFGLKLALTDNPSR
jgi:threonine/homoserine/homoserine lactone efflux protein